MHVVCGYSVVQFLFQSLGIGEKNVPIYDLVLSLTAGGREGRVRGLQTPESATELKKKHI